MKQISDERSQTNKKLYQKYKNQVSFQKEFTKQEQQYNRMRSEAYYSDLKPINEEILCRFDLANHQVYFFYASMYDSNSINVHKLALFFVHNFNPNPEKPYSFVFFNQDAKVDVYGQFKSIFLELTLDHYLYLKNIYLLRPSFFHKAQDFMAYNYIPSFIKSKTIHLNSAKQLCKSLQITEQNFVDFVPKYIADHEFPHLKPRNLALQQNRINFQGQIMSEEERKNQISFESDMKAFLFVKPGKQVYNIEDYELSKIGIPVILELLIFYFKNHPQGLLLEGLFRKSVSIDEENQTLNELANKNYDCLLQVKNPHIVANLIKRFFANLKTPVVPYPQFQKLMHDQGVKNKPQYIKDVINSIPEINYLSIMYVIGFFIEYVIPNEGNNKMTSQNIAICFAPCLMRAQVSGPADLIYASKCMGVNKILIQNYEYIFGNAQERAEKLKQSERQMMRQFEQEVNQSILQEREKKQQEQSQLRPNIILQQRKKKQKSSRLINQVNLGRREAQEKGMIHSIRMCQDRCRNADIEKQHQIIVPGNTGQRTIENKEVNRRSGLMKQENCQKQMKGRVKQQKNRKSHATYIRCTQLSQKKK